MNVDLPPGWPEAVSAPGAEDWEISAVEWLLDLMPEYRQHTTLHRWPVLLAFIIRNTLEGAVEGARGAYRVIRSEMGELAPPHAIDAALKAYRDEGRRLAANARAAGLVERALRGEKFPPVL